MIDQARKLRLRTAAGGLAIAMATGLAGAPGLKAQDSLPPTATDDTAEAIVITGSRIRRDPLDQDQPVVFLDRSDIERTGLTSAADVLQRLPSSGGALNSRFNNSGNFGNPPDGGGVGAGAAEVDLRYLGSKRVLVLVDGLRYVNGASASGVPGSTDLNSIPDSIIDRIEVLQAGASAIYGSDAIAGVVNIITRQQQDGLRASAQIGLFRQGDGTTQDYQLSYGFGGNDDRTRIVIGGNYIRQDSVSSNSRDISLFPTPGADSCTAGGCSSGTPLGRFIIGADDLTLVGPVIGRAPTLADFRPWAGGADAFNFAPFNFIQIPLERYGGFASITHELTENINIRLRGVYNRRNSRNRAAPLPLFIGPDAGNGNLLDTIVIDGSNPFNPFGTLDSSTYALVARRVVEGGPRRYSQSVDTYYVAGTIDGDFNLFNNAWYWDVNGSWGRNDAKQTVLGNVNAANVQRALGPVAACTAPCVPLNIFGGAGSITPEMYDYIAFTQRDSSRQEQWDVTVNVSGGLFELPGGTAALAIGYEHRDQRGRFDPDPTVAAGLGSDIPALPTRGSFNVDEAYAELRLPLLSERPFFHRLELTGAMRWSDYSTSGSTTTFSAGANWEPVRDLLFRGNWSEGFRAPSIGELFGTPSRFDQETTDPCSAGQTDPNTFSTSATVRANCIAVGVPGDGSYVQNNPQLPVVTGGNSDLDAETSESWGVGAVWRPSFVPRLTLEANYYNIRVDGAIQAIDAEVLLGRCANSADAFSCAAITRSASGQVTQIRGFLQNIAGIETDGIDFSLTFRTGETGAGVFGLTWNNTYLLNYTVTVPATDGVTEIDREGTEQGSPDQAFPRYKSTGILDWTHGNLGASLTGRYISRVTEGNLNRMGSRFYTDLQIRWNLDDGFGFALGANNLFNVDPPACFTCGLNNFDPTTYDVPGTFLYARATIRL